ncbi:hypothetical protein [Streptomyces vietnamensis]|uniref:hypothetical protein n=1 Tax=Streptomyces vietnamensis TaxID=362257 RepID=UPI0006960053|nr:hypothetical protein [Streptomyces vietnamensis]
MTIHTADARHDRAPDTAPTPIATLHQAVADFDPCSRRRDTGSADAFKAVLTADAVVVGSFPSTLDAAIAPRSWTGYPPADHHRYCYSYAACAVTRLGSADGIRSWWLHYTQRTDQLGEHRHILTLIAPCACGTYFHVEIPDEDALIAMLDELDTAPGAPVDCNHRLRIRSDSNADQTHDSYEPPF